MATTYQVGIEFKAKGGPELQRLTKRTEELQKAAAGGRLDALNTAIGILPGRAGAALNGIVGLTRGLKEAQNQARATAAEVAALQAVLARKQVQLGAKGGTGKGSERLKREIADIESALVNAESAGGAMAIGLGAVAVAGAAAAAGMAAVTASAVSFTNEIDRNRQQLTLFTKDVKVTNQIIASLQRTADTTSLGLPGLLEATKTMSAYGIEARNAGAATKMLGDLALGDNEKLQRFAVNFAQISSLGKAYTVDLKQFGMAGIPIFDALSKATGKSTAEIMKMAEEGKITYPLVVKALQDLTKEGAAFYNGAERGGTEMDRAVQQMQGSWEKLQQKIGTAVIPAIVGGIKSITEGLDGVVAATDAIGNAFDFINKGPIHSFVNELSYAIGLANKFIKDNPQLLSAVPGVGGALAGYGTLQGLGRKPGAGKKGDPKADEAERAKLAADAQKKAQADAEAEKAKLAQATAEKVAKINLDTERSLADARLGYEQQVSDFRRQQIEKIADMERQLSDERRSEEFKLSQRRSDIASKQRLGQIDQQILDAPIGGDTTALKVARAIEVDRNESAKKRAEIEFNATTRKIELERRMSDFKRETERAMGEMQIAYARQTEGILRQAGHSISDLMVKGAQQAKEILESASFGGGAAAAGGVGGTYIQGGIGPRGANQYGPHFDIKRSDGGYYARNALDQYVSVNGKPLSSGTTVKGGEYGAPRSYGGHAGWDYAFGGQAALSLKNGAKWMGSTPGSHGDEAAFMTPDGKVYKIIHGKFQPGASGPAQGVGGGSLAALAQGAGFTPQQAQVMAAIAMAESSGNPKAHNQNANTGDNSYGLWQINMLGAMGPARRKALGLSSNDQLFDPATNARAAKHTFDSQGFGAWSVYKSGKYKQFLGGDGNVPGAANNIVPTGSIPTTSPGLDKANADLERLRIQDEIAQKKQLELDLTNQIRDAAIGIKVDQDSQLKSAKDKNAVDARTLELMRSGVTPELAAQRASNEQMIRDSAQGLEIARGRAEAAVAEKDITAETKAERQKVLDAVNAQIAAQPGLLGQLNTEAQQTQAIADQRAAMDQAKSDAQGISSTITGGLKDAIKAAVTGGDVKAALSGMLAGLGEKFLDMAMRPLEEMLTNSLMRMFNPQGLAMQANTMALNQLTMTIQTSGAAGGGGGGLGGVGGLLGGLFGGGGGFSGAFSSSFGSSWGGFGGALSMPLLMASGGFVDGPTDARIGEGGANEYVIPENKMGGAMARWSAGARGDSVVSGADPTGGGGGSSGIDNSPATVNITGGILNFNDSHYIRADQVPSIISQGAKQGEARALRKLQNSPGARRKLGI